MSAIIIQFKIHYILRQSSNAELGDYAWQLDFDRSLLETDVLDLNSHQIEERLNLEEKIYELTRDPFYIATFKELDRRELCLKTI